jgi:hypothetical protein
MSVVEVIPDSGRTSRHFRKVPTPEVGSKSTSSPSTQFSYFVTMCRVGVTVLSGAAGEIENVNHVFQPDGRLAASSRGRSISAEFRDLRDVLPDALPRLEQPQLLRAEAAA